jgi:hypothetical protein
MRNSKDGWSGVFAINAYNVFATLSSIIIIIILLLQYVHVALGQALIIYMYALPYRAKCAVVTVRKPIRGGPTARVGDTYETIEC